MEAVCAEHERLAGIKQFDRQETIKTAGKITENIWKDYQIYCRRLCEDNL